MITFSHQTLNIDIRADKVYASKVAWPFTATIITDWIFQKAIEQPIVAEAILLLSALVRTALLSSRCGGIREINRSIRDLLVLRARIVQSLQLILTNSPAIDHETMAIVVSVVLCVEVSGRDYPQR